jgi:hypothetical protein
MHVNVDKARACIKNIFEKKERVPYIGCWVKNKI